MAAEAAVEAEQSEIRLDALRRCLDELPSRQRGLVQSRYGDGMSVSAIAKSQGRSAGSLATFLHRIRRGLLGCIERRLSAMQPD